MKTLVTNESLTNQNEHKEKEKENYSNIHTIETNEVFSK